jgi:hypothetical protein
MTTISGTWRINANGSLGLLTLASNDNASFQGSVTFDDIGGRTDRVTGTWNDVAGQITFTRFLSDTGATQTYSGVLGDNHPENLILAGSFTESDTPTISGWVAAPLQPAVTYVLSLDEFHIKQTRDFFSIPQATDTDYAALNVQVLSQVGYTEVLKLNDPIGKVHGGEDHATGLQFTFRLQPNEALTFSYLIVNSGFDGSNAQQLQQFLDKVSTATRDALNVIYPAEKSIWEVLNDLTQFLNSFLYSGCDGIVAGDKVTQTAAELNQVVPASGNRYAETREYTYHSQATCANPDYTVTWSFIRQ